MGGSFTGGGTLQDVDPLIMTQFLQRTIPGLSQGQKDAGSIAALGLGNTRAENSMYDLIGGAAGNQGALMDKFGGLSDYLQNRQTGMINDYTGKQDVSTGRRRGYQDQYGDLTRTKGEAMTNRFFGGGDDATKGFKPNIPGAEGYNPFGGGKGSGGGGGGFNWSGGGGGPSGASAEAVSEAKRFQDTFGKKNADQEQALKLFGEGRGEASQFAKNMGQDTKYDRMAQDLFKKYEGQMTGRHDMDAKTAALFDELKGQMTGNEYEKEAAGLIRGTTGNILIDQTTPQIAAAKDLFNQTQGAQLTNQMAAAGLGRGAARADVEGRAWATQLPSLIQNEQQFALQKNAAQRDAANQLFGMGGQRAQQAMQAFQTGQQANSDIASRERGIQQNLMQQGIGLNTQQAAAQRAAMQSGYQAQAQALSQQAQAAMAAGDATKARELNAQSNLMNAYGMRSGSEDAAAARGASASAQAAQLAAQMEANRMNLYGSMYGNQADLYNSAEDRALRAMQSEQTSLENMFGRLDSSEQGISADEASYFNNLIAANQGAQTMGTGAFSALSGANLGLLSGAGGLLGNIAGNERTGQQNAFDNLLNYGGLEQQNAYDQFNYDTSEIDRLRQLWAGTLEGATQFSPAPFLTTKTSGGGKKN